MVDLGPPTMLHLKGKLVEGPYAKKEEDNVVTYSERANGSVAVVKIMEPVSPMLNYFEYEIVNRGAKACIAIGVGPLKYPQGQQPGWGNGSIAYHADDGRLFKAAGFGANFGPTCTTGDRMGCGIDFNADASGNHVGVFFTKNGAKIGNMQKIKRPVYGFYPLFGLHSSNESIKYLGHWHLSPDTLNESMLLECSPSAHWIRSNGVRFLNNGLTLEYAGEGGNIQDCTLAQASTPMSVTNHYFELEILESGASCSIAIGLAKLSYPLHRHPGWDPGAIGYHADDGKLFHERGMGEDYGAVCTNGDVMGCGIRFPDGVSENDSNETDDDDSDSDISLPEEPLVGPDMFNFGGIMDYSGSEDEDELPEQLFGRHQQLFGGLRLPRRFRQPQRPIFGAPVPQLKAVDKAKSKGKNRKPVKKVTVYFTRNGEKLRDIECDLPSGGFYPTVAMLSKGEKIKVDLDPLSG